MSRKPVAGRAKDPNADGGIGFTYVPLVTPPACEVAVNVRVHSVGK